MDQSDWSEYFAATLNKPLHPLYSVLDAYLPKQGLALDLGCGVGHGAIHLLDKGLRVQAVDISDEALRLLRSRLHGRQGAELVCTSLEEYMPPRCQVVTAMFSLFFLNRSDMESLWRRVSKALEGGGVFAGQFLGVHDDWHERGYSVFRRAEIDTLLSDFEVLNLQEVERDGFTALETAKHWHVFHVVARKLP